MRRFSGMWRWVVLSQCVAALALVAWLVVAVRAGAEPKAYLVPLAGLLLIGLASRWRRSQSARIIVASLAAALCVASVSMHWAFPLSKTATARLLEARNPAEGTVRCVTPPRPGGYAEFGNQFFGRTYVCGSSNSWDTTGGIRLGQGLGVSVDDTQVVRIWP
jgi:hypothetical protein